MRLLVTGKTRSGKSTALHRLLSCALRQPWAGVLILDGKGEDNLQTISRVLFLHSKSESKGATE